MDVWGIHNAWVCFWGGCTRPSAVQAGVWWGSSEQSHGPALGTAAIICERFRGSSWRDILSFAQQQRHVLVITAQGGVCCHFERQPYVLDGNTWAVLLSLSTW